jgi:zinc resistance-associated protein
MPRFSARDRAAFLDARLAAIRAGLQLSPEQDKMWPAIETAVHDAVTRRREMREKMRAQPAPRDPVERMRRMADIASTRGDSLRKIVDAAQPLYASLSDEQKHRLPFLLHWPRGHMGGMMGDNSRERMHDRFGDRGGRPGERFMHRGGRDGFDRGDHDFRGPRDHRRGGSMRRGDRDGSSQHDRDSRRSPDDDRHAPAQDSEQL